MGYGLPAAVAAALRFRDRPVVCVAGDGDFLMNGQELATAAQYGADLLVILVDNGCYGTIRMHQERDLSQGGSRRPSSPIPTSPRWPGPMAAGPRRVETTDQFVEALDEALSKRGVRLLHLIVGLDQLVPGALMAAISA